MTPPGEAPDGGLILCDSYGQRVPVPSISYGVRAHFRRVMRVPFRSSWRSTDAHHQVQAVADDFPTPGNVLTEVGLLLAIHLGVAVAVAMTVRWFGVT